MNGRGRPRIELYKYSSDGELEIKRYKEKNPINSHLDFGRVKTKGMKQLTTCETSTCLEAWFCMSGLVLLVKKRASWRKTVCFPEISLLFSKWYVDRSGFVKLKIPHEKRKINVTYIVLSHFWIGMQIVFFKTEVVVLWFCFTLFRQLRVAYMGMYTFSQECKLVLL